MTSEKTIGYFYKQTAVGDPFDHLSLILKVSNLINIKDFVVHDVSNAMR